MSEWGQTTLDLIVDELQRTVRLDAPFERRVMVQVRRLHAEERKQRRGLFGAAAAIAHHPAWAGVLAAGVVAIATVGILKARPQVLRSALAASESVQFVLVAPSARSVKVVGDFNNWGLGDTALVATNRGGVWSVTAPVPAGVHRYAFLVNGKQWMADPTAPRASSDDFGMPSSALVVDGGAP
ncbi:MAG: isoamylase early set domain-containing protein [Gemmatimonadaceae bacterium]|nr:isoamylase early set domain-containing protein [Gemmatimonadaceae bacterium]